jgi:glycosyltransferase involved in cell wall biosynthesis
MEKISIRRPIYNVEQYLEKCVMSVLDQSYTNLEILLIDDGSTDRSPEICDELAKKDSRIRTTHKKNGGVSDARNIGIDQATGLYLTFIDPDDFIETDMISLLHDTLSANQCDVSICAVQRFSEGNQPNVDLRQNTLQIMNNEICIEDMLYQKNIVVAILGKLYKTSLFESIRFSKEITIAEDADLNYRILTKAKKIAINSCQKYYYLQRKGSAIHSSFSLKRIDGLIVMRRILKDITIRYPLAQEAAKNRLFIEAIYIATEIPYGNRQYRREFNECIQLIGKLSRNIMNDEQSRKRYRQYAAIALVNASLLIGLLKFRILVGKIKQNLS